LDIIQQSQNSQLKKHVGTVHTSAPLTLLQRKAFSILVFNAYPRLLKDKSHKIPLDVLCELMGFDSKNTKVLEDALEELAKTVIRWEEGEGKNRKWAITTFCAHAIIEKGTCEYEFSDFLAQQLFKPEVYARININTLRDFQSRYGLALYENCARYRPNNDFRGGTPEWPLDKFRRLMGITGTTLYDTFKRLNERIIKPAVAEVNAFSDLLIEPRFVRSGRTVVAVAFSVVDNPQLKLNFSNEAAENPLVVEVYDRYRVPKMKAVEWLDAHGEERFREVLKMTNELVEKGKAKSPVGFMRRAFEENYTPALDVEGERKKMRAQKQAEEQEKKAKTRITGTCLKRPLSDSRPCLTRSNSATRRN
jgi:plasmid replication initiation protein